MIGYANSLLTPGLSLKLADSKRTLCPIRVPAPIGLFVATLPSGLRNSTLRHCFGDNHDTTASLVECSMTLSASNVQIKISQLIGISLDNSILCFYMALSQRYV
jgi:hypothetical protein